MIERRTHAQPLYPGAFFPEEGSSVRVNNDSTTEMIMSRFPNEDYRLGEWFCIEVIEQNWQFWTTGEGFKSEEKWEPANDGSRKSWRIYVGELLTRDDVAKLPGDYSMLLRNMEHDDDLNPVMRTRCGNFQPFRENDVVIASREAVS